MRHAGDGQEPTRKIGDEVVGRDGRCRERLFGALMLIFRFLPGAHLAKITYAATAIVGINNAAVTAAWRTWPTAHALPPTRPSIILCAAAISLRYKKRQNVLSTVTKIIVGGIII
jgi:hypothetical protein